MNDEGLVDKVWDAIVIGAGMGGGIAGRRLAERGLSVLFVDRGPFGPRREQQSLSTELTDITARRVRGSWPTKVKSKVGGKEELFFGAQGTGIGGTSVFYAASLERPERRDFESTPEMLHPTGGWPVGFDAFRPWFDEAQAILDVCGDDDPLSRTPSPRLRAPPPLSESDRYLAEKFRQGGLHPYQMHLGIRFIDGCMECIGRKCPFPCKMDGRSAGVEPALATGRAAFLDDAEVIAVRGAGRHASHLEVMRHGKKMALRSKVYVLAAGALASPNLLLRSTSGDWPNGCGNSSGLIGCNLMFHLNERVAIWSKKGASTQGPRKSLALRDFYGENGHRFGLFQAMGLVASYGEVVQHLNDRFDRSTLKSFRQLRGFTRVPALVASKVLGDAHIYVGVLEDLPYRENRVVIDADEPDRLSFVYTMAPELLARREAFRRLIKKRLPGWKSIFLTFEPQLNIGHPCGTLRFSLDPASGVLDANCRSHDVDNLYVVDSSFMPTSTGVNPSLTIAANALRVADAIAASSQ